MSNSAIGQSWDEFEKEFYTPEEIAESNLRVALSGELIKARNEKGLCHLERLWRLFRTSRRHYDYLIGIAG